MNTHFFWEVLSLKKYSQINENQNIVYQVGWKVTGISTIGSEVKSASVDGWVSLDPNVENPIAYESLDSETVLQWVKDSLMEVGVVGYENQVVGIMNSDDYESTPPWK